MMSHLQRSTPQLSITTPAKMEDVGTSWIDVRLAETKSDIRLQGNTDSYLFFSDPDYAVDVILKRFNWVACVKPGEFALEHGYFSDLSANERDMFVDTDPLVMGPETPLVAVVYEDGQIFTAEVIGESLEIGRPAQFQPLKRV